MGTQKIYTGHVRMHYVAKNKLQQAASDYIDTLDGKAFTQEQYLQIRKQIELKVKELNAKHKRAKPIQIYWHKMKGVAGKEVIYLHQLQAIDFAFITGELAL